METTFADSWSDIARSCDIDFWVMKWRSAWPILHSPVILPYILKTIWWLCMNSILLDYELIWPEVDLKINVGHCDLYFMVQWFCLVSWRQFDVWTSLVGIVNQFNVTFDLKIIVCHCNLYSWSSDFMLYLEDYLIYEQQTSGLCVIMTRHLTSK